MAILKAASHPLFVSDFSLNYLEGNVVGSYHAMLCFQLAPQTKWLVLGIQVEVVAIPPPERTSSRKTMPSSV